jgi:hypothetical protein
LLIVLEQAKTTQQLTMDQKKKAPAPAQRTMDEKKKAPAPARPPMPIPSFGTRQAVDTIAEMELLPDTKTPTGGPTPGLAVAHSTTTTTPTPRPVFGPPRPPITSARRAEVRQMMTDLAMASMSQPDQVLPNGTVVYQVPEFENAPGVTEEEHTDWMVSLLTTPALQETFSGIYGARGGN